MLIEVEGDLLTAPEPLIAHGVNSLGKFGAGVAGAIARKWPEVKKAYLNRYNDTGWRLGDIQVVGLGPEERKPRPMIANCCTQASIGRSGVHADLEAIRQAVTSLVHYTYCDIAMPRIGCGLGGLDWADVRPVIESAVPKHRRVVVYTNDRRENSR